MRRPRWDDWDEPSVKLEAIERRGEPRGVIRGLTLRLPVDAGAALDAVEASVKGFFARVDDPERYRLGEVHEVEARRGPVAFRCQVEVVRKEIAPRPGVALRIVRIAPDAQAQLTALVAAD